MILWVALGLMTLAALAALLWPLLRARPPAADRLDHDLAVYKAQLAELEVEVGRGAIAPEEATLARAEIERRMRRAADAERPAPAQRRGLSIGAAAGVAVLLPALAAGVYHRLGAPNPPAARPPAVAQAAAGQAGAGQAGGGQQGTGGELGTMVERLAARLKNEPNDLDGWMLLGRSYLQSGRPGDAIGAYTRALSLAPNDSDVQVAFGEALVFAADGIVTPPARSAFAQALIENPTQAGARYYLGLAEAQAGRKPQAYDAWLELARDTPPDAPWAALIKRQLTQLGGELGRDVGKDMPPQLADGAARPSAAAPAPSAAPQAQAQAQGQPPAARPRGPSQEDMKAAAEMSPEDRAAFIRTMVEGLAARLKEKPDDPDGWIRLARAYGVLGETEKQRDAYARLAELRPNDPGALQQAARAIVQAEMKPGSGPPADAVKIYGKLLALQPEHGEALWFTGLGAAYAGDRKAAAQAFEKLLAQLDPTSAEYGQVKAQLDKVKAGG